MQKSTKKAMPTKSTTFDLNDILSSRFIYPQNGLPPNSPHHISPTFFNISPEHLLFQPTFLIETISYRTGQISVSKYSKIMPKNTSEFHKKTSWFVLIIGRGIIFCHVKNALKTDIKIKLSNAIRP